MNKIGAIAVNTCQSFISWKKLLLLLIPFFYLGLISLALQIFYRNQEAIQIYYFAQIVQHAVFFVAGLLPIIKLFGDFRLNRFQTVLTKPVRGWKVLLGIFLGCQLFLFGLILILDVFLQAILIVKGGGLDFHLNAIMLFTFFACMPMTGFMLFLAILLNPVAAGITFFLFQPGMIEGFAQLIEHSNIAAIYKIPVVFILNSLTYLFPQMSEFQLQDNFFVYRIIEPYRLAWAVVYAFDYTAVMILVAAYFFYKKSLIKGG